MSVTMEGEAPEVVISVKEKVCILRFNRPKKKNALTPQVYRKVIETLDSVANDPEITIMVVTGTGDYFSSGNEFSMKHLQDQSEESMDDRVSRKTGDFQRFIDILIDFPKPLIAVVNGPAVGVAVTMLSHFDVVFASDKATFHTPFITLAVVAEGCSSYLFPRIMGPGMAAQMLLFGKKITAAEALQHNLVTKVVPDENIDQAWTEIYNWASLPPNTMIAIKGLIKHHHKESLHKVNAKEAEVLGERFREPEFFEAMVKFLSRKSKL